MKKIITLVLAVMLLATLAISAMAETYMEKPSCEFEVTVKKADPAVVKKDGVIDLEGGEYIKADVPFEELAVSFATSEAYMAADAMAHTMEYYFSWDDTHGFNFAVKYFAKGNYDGTDYDGYYTNIPEDFGFEEDSEVTGDNFLCNMGLNFCSGKHPEDENWTLLFHAIGKTLDGTYMNGYYQQRGASGSYLPVGGQDFEVAYPGDGSVIFEWSVPFSEILNVTPADGVSFTFFLVGTAGATTTEATFGNNWSVALGQGGFMVAASEDNRPATAILSAEPIKASAPVVTTAPETTTPDAPVTTAPVTTAPATSSVVTSVDKVTDTDGNVMTDGDGNDVTTIVTSILTDAPTQDNNDNDVNSPVTGDPMVIAAVVAAISACGVVVAKKRK